MKTIVNVKFKTKMKAEQLEKVSSKDMSLLVEVEGLISKNYWSNSNTGFIGAVYFFENDSAADNYMSTPFFKSMDTRYQIEEDSLSVEKENLFYELEGLNTKSRNQVTKEEWKQITSTGILEEAITASVDRPIVIFKYSNRCPISRSVLRKFDEERKRGKNPDVEFYLLEVVEHRDLSVLLADKLNIQHVSPQMLLITNMQCSFYENGFSIDYGSIIEKTSNSQRVKQTIKAQMLAYLKTR